MRAAMGAADSLLLRALVALLPTLAVAQAPSSPPPPCTDCISGICYQPPPTADLYVEQPRNIRGQLLPMFMIRQRMSLPAPGYPSLPMWSAWTCPIPYPIKLLGLAAPLPGTPSPPANPGPPPGTPASRPAGSTGTPPVPPYPGGGPWPPNMFFCHPNTFNPYGPSGTPGSGAPGGTTPAPLPPTSTPSGPPPAPSGGSAPGSSPPVPFGPDGNSAAVILLKSGCYTPVDCPVEGPVLGPGFTTAGTIVTFWVVCNGSESLAHSAISNGNGTLNSKNGTFPHTPDISFWDVYELYTSPTAAPINCSVVVRCFQKTC